MVKMIFCKWNAIVTSWAQQWWWFVIFYVIITRIYCIKLAAMILSNSKWHIHYHDIHIHNLMTQFHYYINERMTWKKEPNNKKNHTKSKAEWAKWNETTKWNLINSIIILIIININIWTNRTQFEQNTHLFIS